MARDRRTISRRVNIDPAAVRRAGPLVTAQARTCRRAGGRWSTSWPQCSRYRRCGREVHGRPPGAWGNLPQRSVIVGVGPPSHRPTSEPGLYYLEAAGRYRKCITPCRKNCNCKIGTSWRSEIWARRKWGSRVRRPNGIFVAPFEQGEIGLVSRCLPNGTGRSRLQASRSTLPRRTVKGLAQDEEPEASGHEPGD
jgi:hypothetical protein